MTAYDFNVLVKDQTETVVASAVVTAYDSTGTVAATGTTNASGVLASALSLDTDDNTHLVTVTKSGYTTHTEYFVLYQEDTSHYVRLPAYSSTYCSVSEVAQFLGLTSTFFTSSTTPTDSAVSDMIVRNEGEIDRFVMSSFKSNSISEEFHDINFRALTQDGFMPIFPVYRPLLTKDATWEIECYDGSTYTDYVTGKTEGRGEDYYIDYNKSILYFKPLAYGDQYLRLTYTWGRSTVPGEIEKLCILKTALNLVDLDDFAGNIRVGDQPLSTKRDSYLQQIRALEKNIRIMKF